MSCRKPKICYDAIMEYAREKLKKSRSETRKKLIDFYLDSKTYEEFCLNVDVKLPEADKFDLLACKCLYLKKNKPYAWIAVVFGSLGICLGTSFLLSGAIRSGVVAWLAFAILYQNLLGDFMRDLELKERHRH